MGKIQQGIEKNKSAMAVFANYFQIDAKNRVAKTQLQLEEECKKFLPTNLINLNNVLCDYQTFTDTDENNCEQIADWNVSQILDHFELENAFNQANVSIDFISRNKCENAIHFRAFQRSIKNQLAPRYSKISRHPSWPAINGELVLGNTIEPEDNGAIRRFVDEFFRPLTEIDRKLMYAHLVTPMWGAAGKKPLFIIAGPDGFDEKNTKKIGKSTYVEALQKIHLSEFDLSPDGDKPQLLNSILQLCVHAMVRIDNLKTKLPPGILERCITSAYIQAHGYYRGQMKIPNRTCWNITANTPRVDQDLADRGIVIRLEVPVENDQHYGYRLENAIKQNRLAILKNAMFFLQQSPVIFAKAITRFPEWEHMILNKFLAHDQVSELQNKNAADQIAISESDDHEYFKDHVLHAIRLYYAHASDPHPGIANNETHCVYVSSKAMFEFWKEWHPEKKNVKYSMPWTADVLALCEKIGWKQEIKRIGSRKIVIRCFKISQVDINKQSVLIEHHYKTNRVLTLF